MFAAAAAVVVVVVVVVTAIMYGHSRVSRSRDDESNDKDIFHRLTHISGRVSLSHPLAPLLHSSVSPQVS